MIVAMLVHVTTIMERVHVCHTEEVYHVKRSYVQCILNYVHHAILCNVSPVFLGFIYPETVKYVVGVVISIRGAVHVPEKKVLLNMNCS